MHRHPQRPGWRHEGSEVRIRGGQGGQGGYAQDKKARESQGRSEKQVWKLPYAMSHMVNCKSVNVSIGHLN